MADPFDVVRQFEAALTEYTGARYAVAVTSCTMAILLAVAWTRTRVGYGELRDRPSTIPKLTYVGVPMSIIHAGGSVEFEDLDWQGKYQIKPYPIWDCARRFTSNMFPQTVEPRFQCVSFHHSKILGLAAHGGAILHNDHIADPWLRRARFDGRTEGVAPKGDTFDMLGWHCYMTPATAAEGLMRLSVLPRHNEDLPRSDYADLSKVELFR